MELAIFVIGFTIGFIFCLIFKRREYVYGQVDIDSITGLCRFRISSDKIADPRKKHAIFKINHNVDISRDEQWL